MGTILRNNARLLAIGSLTAALIVGGSYLTFGLNPGWSAGIVVVAAGIAWGLMRWRARGPLPWRDGLPLGRALAWCVAGLLVTGVLIQAVPYGRAHANPPVAGEPAWDSPATRDLVVRACFDCHSNETEWPWYSTIAPFSWAVADHVREGRAVLNFSDWHRPQGQAGETTEVVAEGEMPPAYFTAFGLTHPEAQLTAAERRQLVDGLRASVGG